MEKNRGFRSYNPGAIFLFTLGVFQLGFPLLASFTQPNLMMYSDFLLTFYPAGKLILGQHASDLYHCGTNLPFMVSAFNTFVHQIYPHLPKEYTAIFMYSPLTALIFYPFSLLTPQISLIAWQLTSIVAFFFSIFFTSKANGQDFKACFWYGLLYFAVFQTILIGQLGIVFGLLPLSAGYFLLMRQRPFLAGFCWSFILLKPQFLPVPLLVIGSLALHKQLRCCLGFVAGLILLLSMTSLWIKPYLFTEWIASLKMSDTIFSDPHYLYPFYLITSLPAAILHFFPISSRNIVKIPAYLFAFLLSLHALWLSFKIIKNPANTSKYSVTSVFIIGIALLPLILPHFLFYDFSVFALFAVLFRGSIWTDQQKIRLKVLDWFYVICIDIYYLLLSTPARIILQPIILIILIAFLYYRILKILKNDFAKPRIDAAKNPA